MKRGEISHAASSFRRISDERGPFSESSPLAVLAGRSGARRAYAAVDLTRVALPVAVGVVVVGVGVRGARARLEEGVRGAVGDLLFRVVADGTGTLIPAGVAVAEKCCWGGGRVSLGIGWGQWIEGRGSGNVRMLHPVTATPEQEQEMGTEKPST